MIWSRVRSPESERAAGLQQLDGVAQFGGAFVHFLGDRAFHFALHDLQFRERTFGAHFLEPFVEKVDLGTFRRELGKIRALEKIRDRVAPALNLAHRFREFSLAEQNGRPGTRIHHQHVRPELLQAPGKLFAIGVRENEVEKIEVALGVAYDAGEIVDLKQTEITVIILNAFLLELGALLWRQLVIFRLFLCAHGAALMISEERLAIVRPLSIGPAGHFHLQHAEIDPQLQFLPAIEPDDLAHLDRAVLVRPVLQDRVQIQTHRKSSIEHLPFLCQWAVPFLQSRIARIHADGAERRTARLENGFQFFDGDLRLSENTLQCFWPH
jgi:hypothetical protein